MKKLSRFNSSKQNYKGIVVDGFRETLKLSFIKQMEPKYKFKLKKSNLSAHKQRSLAIFLCNVRLEKPSIIRKEMKTCSWTTMKITIKEMTKTKWIPIPQKQTSIGKLIIYNYKFLKFQLKVQMQNRPQQQLSNYSSNKMIITSGGLE